MAEQHDTIITTLERDFDKVGLCPVPNNKTKMISKWATSSDPHEANPIWSIYSNDSYVDDYYLKYLLSYFPPINENTHKWVLKKVIEEKTGKKLDDMSTINKPVYDDSKSTYSFTCTSVPDETFEYEPITIQPGVTGDYRLWRCSYDYENSGNSYLSGDMYPYLETDSFDQDNITDEMLAVNSEYSRYSFTKFQPIYKDISQTKFLLSEVSVLAHNAIKSTDTKLSPLEYQLACAGIDPYQVDINISDNKVSLTTNANTAFYKNRTDDLPQFFLNGLEELFNPFTTGIGYPLVLFGLPEQPFRYRTMDDPNQNDTGMYKLLTPETNSDCPYGTCIVPNTFKTRYIEDQGWYHLQFQNLNCDLHGNINNTTGKNYSYPIKDLILGYLDTLYNYFYRTVSLLGDAKVIDNVYGLPKPITSLMKDIASEVGITYEQLEETYGNLSYKYLKDNYYDKFVTAANKFLGDSPDATITNVEFTDEVSYFPYETLYRPLEANHQGWVWSWNYRFTNKSGYIFKKLNITISCNINTFADITAEANTTYTIPMWVAIPNFYTAAVNTFFKVNKLDDDNKSVAGVDPEDDTFYPDNLGYTYIKKYYNENNTLLITDEADLDTVNSYRTNNLSLCNPDENPPWFIGVSGLGSITRTGSTTYFDDAYMGVFEGTALYVTQIHTTKSDSDFTTDYTSGYVAYHLGISKEYVTSKYIDTNDGYKHFEVSMTKPHPIIYNTGKLDVYFNLNN